MLSDLSFRWLGVQTVELTCETTTLVIDPFVTRPPLRSLFFGRPKPDAGLTTRLLPRADAILVTHGHYDHVMDAPALARQSAAPVYGSANIGAILAYYGVPATQFHRVQPGDKITAGPFVVEVFAKKHIPTPIDRIINGLITARSSASGFVRPLRLLDYRMDESFGFSIRVNGLRMLFNPGPPVPAEILFAGIALPETYRSLLQSIQPRLVIPLHWDYFYRRLDQPVREINKLGRMSLAGFAEITRQVSPGTRFFVPRILQRENLMELM